MWSVPPSYRSWFRFVPSFGSYVEGRLRRVSRLGVPEV